MSESRQEMNEYQRAALVARFVEVHEVALRSLEAKLLMSRERALEADEPGLSFDKSASFHFEEASRSLSVQVRFDCSLRGLFERGGSKGKDTRDIFNLKCEFEIDYTFLAQGGPPAEQREQFFQAFADVNGLYNSWPYLRELVHSTVIRMGIPPVVLPVYRVPTPAKPQVAAAPSKQLVEASGNHHSVPSKQHAKPRASGA
jgi:hypothetical protein